ncbi:hypothetical protein DUI87_28452 [Hirundo rustica rustica]|uniref:Uncharacterized protein n=1 Tax=Hirundo rustica rustica TaxID=333673 RepID=A0A3M0J0W8_HIRRU|nr:hypothetical protein DUI87_28452 [Hirundo rustica rustica]
MHPICVLIIISSLSCLIIAWIVPQPWQNVWVTLAQALNHENICLSTAAAEDPMSTCLVGIPLRAEEYPAPVAVSIFLPWVAVAKVLGELGHLECWVAKQANLTSATICSLLEDEEITRQVTFQNPAAIDFLLLLHGHDYQEFEGLCCMNLSSKAPNVHMALREMRLMIGQ